MKIQSLALFVLITLLLFARPVLAISEDDAYKIADNLYQLLAEDLANQGFGEPDVRIDPVAFPDEVMRVNFIDGMYDDENNRVDYYRIEIGAIAMKKKLPKLCFAQMICHEFGHLLGKDINGKRIVVTADNHFELNDKTAPEGEADYQSLLILNRLVKKMPSLLRDSFDKRKIKIAENFVAKKTKIKKKAQISYLAKLITAAQTSLELTSDTNIKISPEKTDHKKVKKTIMSYPSNQARLDSAIAGLLNLPRPRSWWAPRK